MIANNNRVGDILIKSLIFGYDDYEIYRMYNYSSLLIVRKNLYDRWLTDGIFYSVNPFKEKVIDGSKYYVLKSEKQYLLQPVQNGNMFCDRKSAVTFAFALKQMRKVTETSLYDGIYLEEFGYILPTYTDDTLSDDALLGAYFSGGRIKHFSDADFTAQYMDEFVLDEITDIIGISRNAKVESETMVTDSTADASDKTRPADYGVFHLAGRFELERFFNEHIVNVLNEPERYSRLGIGFPSSVILYGPPGCGKTYAVNKLVEFLKLPKYEINSASVASSYIHDTAKKISEIFDKAIKNAPSVVIIDEMESYLSNRDTADSSTHHIEEVAEFLRRLQEAQERKVLIFGMTNMLDKIDPAIMRAGRFDHCIEVGLPAEEEILSLLHSITEKVCLAADIDLAAVSKKLVGKSLADVAFVIKEAGLLSGKNGDSEITVRSIDAAIAMLPKSEEKRTIGF